MSYSASVHIADETRRIAANNGIGRHIFRHHRTCGHHSVLSYCDTRQNGGSGPNPSIAADVDRLT